MTRLQFLWYAKRVLLMQIYNAFVSIQFLVHCQTEWEKLISSSRYSCSCFNTTSAIRDVIPFSKKKSMGLALYPQIIK